MSSPARAPKVILGAGMALLLGVAIFALSRKPAPPPERGGGAKAASGESGYVGARGWVLRLPPNYEGSAELRGPAKTEEVVHFCPRGTDPTNFLNEGLFGPLGIVRLEVVPSPFPPTPTGAAQLARAVSGKLTMRRDKFALKNVQIATLPGVQANISGPFPHVEAYILGQRDLYAFYGGQEDDVWRDIVLSLRDAQSEN